MGNTKPSFFTNGPRELGLYFKTLGLVFNGIRSALAFG